MRRVIVVIEAADRDAANADALAFDPEGGARTFTVGLSPSGAGPVTHYWMGAAMSEATYQAATQLWQTKYSTGHLEDWDMDADPGRPDALLTELGLRRVTVGSEP